MARPNCFREASSLLAIKPRPRHTHQASRLDDYWREWQATRPSQPGETMRVFQTLRTQYRVSDFVSWQREGALRLNPKFQRRPVWKKLAKSYLIDTILRGLPVPIIFLRDLPADLKTFKSVRDVVDGQQRIRTILSFVDPTLLPDFDPDHDEFTISRIHNKELGGSNFDKLTPEDQRQILDYQFSVHSFSSDIDDREILQIFARMNSTGVKLNPQELRNAEFFGLFKTTAYELALEQLFRWQDWSIFTSHEIARMSEVELTSELMILIMSGISGRPKETLDIFYEAYDEHFEDEHEVARRFRITFDAIETHIQAEVMRALFSTRTLFYALFAAFYDSMFGLPAPARRGTRSPKLSREWLEALPRLSRERPNPLSSEAVKRFISAGKAIKERSAPEQVQTAIRGATTDTSARRILIGYLTGKSDEASTTTTGQVS